MDGNLTGNIEKYGSGFIRIRKELQDYPDVSLDVAEIGGGLLVTFKQSEGVNEGVNALLQCIEQNQGLRLPDISRLMNVPAKTVERWLKQLKHENRIMFRGAPKSGGYFVVTETEVQRGR